MTTSWTSPAPVPSLPAAADWYRITAVGDAITLIDEPHVHELLRANIWHLRGRDRDLLVDCGLGITSLRPALSRVTAREPVLVLTHAHLDHMGSAHEFSDCRAHPHEPVEHPPPGSLQGPVLAGELGLSGELAAELPSWLITAVPHADYAAGEYRLRPARITHPIGDGDTIDLGDRSFTVLHLPGHSPGSIALFDEHDGTLFSGDVIYDDLLLDDIVGADVHDYAASMRRLRELPVRVVHPGHGDSFDRARLHALIDQYLAPGRRRAPGPDR